MNWQLRFYIGTPVTPEDLQEQWNALEALSAGDVGFQTGVIHMGAQILRDAPPLPDMPLLGALLEQGQFREAGARIDQYVLPLARQDQISTQWLMQLRDELLQAI